MIKSRFLKEIKGYFSIFITFIILMIIFAHNLSFSVTCESQVGNGRTTLDHCELNNIKIGEKDVDGNVPITCGLKENIGKGQRDSDHLEYDPWTSPDYFYDTKNTYCLIWGLTMSIAYSTAAQIAHEACDRAADPVTSEAEDQVSRFKIVQKIKDFKKKIDELKAKINKAVAMVSKAGDILGSIAGSSAASALTDPFIAIQIELGIDLAKLGFNIAYNTNAVISSAGTLGVPELTACLIGAGSLTAGAFAELMVSTAAIWGAANDTIEYIDLCGKDWETLVYTKNDLERFNNDFSKMYPQKGPFANSYKYKLDKCLKYGETEAEKEFGIDCNEVSRGNGGYCDLGDAECKNIKITTRSLKNRLYRETLYNGKEFAIDKEYFDSTCRDPRLPENKGFSGDEQRYYFRGNDAANYACNRFIYKNQGCVSNDKEITTEDLMSDPSKVSECRQEFEKAYNCCKNRAALGVCIYNTKDEEEDGDYGRTPDYNCMTLRGLGVDDDNISCRVGFDGGIVAPEFVAFTSPNDSTRICVQNVDQCPYSYNLQYGTSVKQEYCYGDTSCSIEMCENIEDEEEKKECQNRIHEDQKVIWDGKRPTPAYGKVKNFCYYNRHCTDIGDIGGSILEQMSTNKFLPPVCSNFIGDSKNLPVSDHGSLSIDLNNPVTEHLVAGVDFSLGQYRGFTAPMAQCIRETLSNLFLNKAGISVCKDGSTPNDEGLCGADSLKYPDKINKNNYIYFIGDKLNDDDNIFLKIQKRLQLIIKLGATLAIVLIGLNFLLKGDLDIFDLKKPKLMIVAMVKFAIVFYFAVGNAWQDKFYELLDAFNNALYTKTFQLSLVDYQNIKQEKERYACLKTEEKLTSCGNPVTISQNNSYYKIPLNATKLKIETFGESDLYSNQNTKGGYICGELNINGENTAFNANDYLFFVVSDAKRTTDETKGTCVYFDHQGGINNDKVCDNNNDIIMVCGGSINSYGICTRDSSLFTECTGDPATNSEDNGKIIITPYNNKNGGKICDLIKKQCDDFPTYMSNKGYSDKCSEDALNNCEFKSREDLCFNPVISSSVQIISKHGEIFNQIKSNPTFTEPICEFDFDSRTRICYSDCSAVQSEGGSAGSNGVEYEWSEKYDGCYFGDEKYPEGKDYLSVFDSLDCKLAKFFNYGPEISVPGILMFLLLSIIWSPLAIFVVILGFLFFIILLKIVVDILLRFIKSFLAINLFVYISPIVFSVSLFNKYKGWLNKWMMSVLGYTLHLAIVMVYAGFLIGNLENLAIGDAKYINHDINGRLPTLDCRDTVASLVCLFNIGSSAGTVPLLGDTVTTMLGIGPIIYIGNALFNSDFVETVVILLKGVMTLFVLLKFMGQLDDTIEGLVEKGSKGGGMSIRNTVKSVKSKLGRASRIAKYGANTVARGVVKGVGAIKEGKKTLNEGGEMGREYRKRKEEEMKKKQADGAFTKPNESGSGNTKAGTESAVSLPVDGVKTNTGKSGGSSAEGASVSLSGKTSSNASGGAGGEAKDDASAGGSDEPAPQQPENTDQ